MKKRKIFIMLLLFTCVFTTIAATLAQNEITSRTMGGDIIALIENNYPTYTLKYEIVTKSYYYRIYETKEHLNILIATGTYDDPEDAVVALKEERREISVGFAKCKKQIGDECLISSGERSTAILMRYLNSFVYINMDGNAEKAESLLKLIVREFDRTKIDKSESDRNVAVNIKSISEKIVVKIKTKDGIEMEIPDDNRNIINYGTDIQDRKLGGCSTYKHNKMFIISCHIDNKDKKKNALSFNIIAADKYNRLIKVPMKVTLNE